MRLSTLALFIVLPAAAYAAASPRDYCIEIFHECDDNHGIPCCEGTTCIYGDIWGIEKGVGLICRLLRFTFGTELNTVLRCEI